MLSGIGINYAVGSASLNVRLEILRHAFLSCHSSLYVLVVKS